MASRSKGGKETWGATGMSILEYKSVQSIPRLGAEKNGFQEWVLKSKNTVRPLMENGAWEWWMEVAERSFR